ncbi:MAG: substrate-binding domain-containing protein [Lentimicrobiaceae bacterium]|jgi:ABC-type molybdate transport system substrate-binding protein
MKTRIYLTFANNFGFLVMILLITSFAYGQKTDPPWCTPPAGFNFTVPGIENVPDLHGDIVNPDLVVFFAGNQFMVVPELIDSFRAVYPKYQRIFVETLPPGILAEQIDKGSLVIGNMKITLTPDVFTAGEARINESKAKGWFEETVPYAKNRLAIMVYKGNPKKVYSLEDLSKPEIRVSMPNPKWEGIGGNIVKAYNNVGGKALEEKIMVKKVKAGTTFLTHIHHRQTPVRIMKGESDAGPVWYTEAYFQKMIGNPIDMVEIPTKDNIVGTYVAGKMKSAPHQEAAKDFFNFLQSEKAGAIYKKYGFLPVK